MMIMTDQDQDGSHIKGLVIIVVTLLTRVDLTISTGRGALAWHALTGKSRFYLAI